MNNRKIEIFKELEKGLKIENKKWDLKWGTSLVDLFPRAENSRIENGHITWLNFGELSFWGGIQLYLCAPFDTHPRNKGLLTLNHLGTNLSLRDVPDLERKLIELLGTPDEYSDTYGIDRTWKRHGSYVSIRPRMAHGSDWSSIIIGKETRCSDEPSVYSVEDINEAGAR